MRGIRTEAFCFSANSHIFSIRPNPNSMYLFDQCFHGLFPGFHFSYSNTMSSPKVWLAFLVSTYNKNEPGSSAIMMATSSKVYSFITQNALTVKKSPSGFTCIINIHTGGHDQEISVLAGWQRGPSLLRPPCAHPSSAGNWYAALAQLHKKLVCSHG